MHSLLTTPTKWTWMKLFSSDSTIFSVALSCCHFLNCHSGFIPDSFLLKRNFNNRIYAHSNKSLWQCKTRCTKSIQEKCIYVNANAYLHASKSILKRQQNVTSPVFAFTFKTSWFNSLSNHLKCHSFLAALVKFYESSVD